MAAKKLVYITNERGDCNVPSLWRAFDANQELNTLHLKLRTVISEENSQLFEEWCRYFGFKLMSLEIESLPPVEHTLDPKSFDNLTTFTAVHDHNFPLSKKFLSYLCKFSPAITSLSVRCEAEALPAIGSFSCLKYLNISLAVPWYLTPDQLSDWTDQHVVSVLPDQFNMIAPHLETFVVYARRVQIPWSLMNLSHLTELDADTGLFRQLLCLTHSQKLHRLTYAYYGTEFSVSEIDDWEVLMEHLHKLSSVRFRISDHFKDRVEAINWLATFAEDWPNTAFRVDDYWDDNVVVSGNAADNEGNNVVHQTRSKTAVAGSSVLVVRSENMIAKVPLEDQKHFAKFRTVSSW